MTLRGALRIVEGQATTEGAGVRLTRTIGTPTLDHLDPFLLLDEFKSDETADYIAGFPDHPHRGFETVTYMLAGSMQHKDHKGNEGNLVAGSVQWMTAGKGIIHSEMPQQEDGLLWGFQLWVNLPATQKLTEPSYQEIAPEDIPVVDLENGVRIRVIAGSANSVDGAVRGIATAPLYLDVNTPANTNFEQPVPQGHNAFIYVYEGEAALRGGDGDSQSVDRGHLVVLGDGDAVALETGGQPARFLLVAARPINEPIARYGPFVMTTKEEIHQAIHDFQAGQF